MPRQEHVSPAALAGAPPAATRGPHWRAVLEARWRVRLAEVTELSLAYYTVTAVSGDRSGKAGPEAGPPAQRLLHRTVTARRKLADVEDALTRLAAGRFGSCEQCGSAIPATLLTIVPETRYCLRCDEPVPARTRRPAIAGQAPR
ncbi:MAG: hypothetical protein M3Z75_16260 [Actinomycetota bacterium]|nr:hypothetical protein [Actinomycetota bacterium]